MKQRTLGKRAVLAAMLLGVSAFAGSACYAAEGADLDLTQKGSITIDFSSEENKVTDGAITVYQVATLYFDNGDMAYELTDDFAEFEGELDVTAASLSQDLAEYVEAHTAEDSGDREEEAVTVTGTEQAIGEDGTVVFTDLEPGLYLVTQTVQSSGYYVIDSFVVTIPLDVNGEWVYDVNASPKTEIEPETETESESEEESEPETESESESESESEPQSESESEPQSEPESEPESESEPQSESETEPQTEPESEPQSESEPVETESESEPQSEPQSESESEIESETEIESESEIQSESELESEFESEYESESESEFESESESEYETENETETETESETEIETESGTEIETESETQRETVPQTETDQSEPATESESETETEKLPQTGQLNWPIPFLAAGGVVLLAAGILLSRPKNKEGE